MNFFPAYSTTSSKSLLLAFAVSGLLAANVSCASPEPLRANGYQLHDLGTLGGATSSAAAVDQTGTVAGESLTVLGERRAFHWCSDCDMHSLGTLQNGSYSFATDISGNGEWIVGNSGIRPAQTPEQFADIRQGFVWTDSGMESVGALYNPATVNSRFGTSEAHGVNDLGQVVGFSLVQRQNLHSAFLWQDGVLTDIGLANEDGSSSKAFDINNAGQVVGAIVMAGFVNAESEAFLWQGGTFQYLPHGLGYSSSTAAAINIGGLVAGWSGDGDDTTAVVWSGTSVNAIGALDGDAGSRALGVNDVGQVVGWSGEAGDSRAFIWQAGRMMDLNSLLPRRSGWTLVEATDVNNDGTIVGTGLKDGQLHAFMLQPPSAAAAMNHVLNTVKTKSDKAVTKPKTKFDDLMKAIKGSSSLEELLTALR